jgi:hypothetical protein
MLLLALIALVLGRASAAFGRAGRWLDVCL